MPGCPWKAEEKCSAEMASVKASCISGLPEELRAMCYNLENVSRSYFCSTMLQWNQRRGRQSQYTCSFQLPAYLKAYMRLYPVTLLLETEGKSEKTRRLREKANPTIWNRREIPLSVEAEEEEKALWASATCYSAKWRESLPINPFLKTEAYTEEGRKLSVLHRNSHSGILFSQISKWCTWRLAWRDFGLCRRRWLPREENHRNRHIQSDLLSRLLLSEKRRRRNNAKKAKAKWHLSRWRHIWRMAYYHLWRKKNHL